MSNKAEQLFAAVLKKEKSWWYASREFYTYCSEFTRDELERKWEDTWRKMAVDHFRNADTYPDCEEVVPRGHSQIARWKENVNQRRFQILAKAKDGDEKKPRARKAIQRQGHELDRDSSETMTAIVIDACDPEENRIDKLLNVYSKLTPEGKAEFMKRATRLA